MMLSTGKQWCYMIKRHINTAVSVCLMHVLFLSLQGLVFRKESHQLFSCSHDRSVKIWNVDERAYVETL